MWLGVGAHALAYRNSCPKAHYVAPAPQRTWWPTVCESAGGRRSTMGLGIIGLIGAIVIAVLILRFAGIL